MLLEPENESPDLEMEVMPPTVGNIQSILGAVGLGSPEEEDEELDPEQHIQAVLKKHSAGLDNAARQLGNLLVSADSDATKLRAVEAILKMHKVPGFTGTTEESTSKGNVFNITIVGSQNKNLLQVLIPSQT